MLRPRRLSFFPAKRIEQEQAASALRGESNMTRPSEDRSSPVDWASVPPCPYASSDRRQELEPRGTPYWHTVAMCRGIGVYAPNARTRTWIARVLTVDGRYIQHRLASAREGDVEAVSYDEALTRAITWFESAPIRAIAQSTRPKGRTEGLNFCPFGPIYTIGSALAEYIEWSRIARTAGSHYNNIALINYHFAGLILFEPLETFNASHLRDIAVKVIETHPERTRGRLSTPDRAADVHRRSKRVFNNLVTILRMAFRLAWDSGRIETDRPLRSLHRISVPPAARTLFLSREECRRLICNCTPGLASLVLAGLYTGCRVGELANLRVSDVGREVYGLHVAAFKLAPARFVFLPDEAMAFFLECCEGKGPTDRILLSDKGKVWSRQHANLFRRAVAKSGLPSEFVFHGLRHTYASDLVRNGVQLSLVARQLGHSDTRSVSATYGHLAERFREDQIRERFSPLSDLHQNEATRQEEKLSALWISLHGTNWRDYGSGIEQPSRQARSSVRTSAEVLEAFNIHANGAR